MTKTQKQQTVVSVLIFLVILIIDQVIKISVKTGMTLHESIRITDWFYISYIENNGMAWGMSIMPKIMLSLFRLVAIFVIGWYIFRQITKGTRWLYVVLLSMVLAGAAGNLIDCMFYGMIFSGASPNYTSFFVPWGTGYAPFLEGRVVAMFPSHSDELSRLVPCMGGREIRILQSCVQLCRCKHQCKCCGITPFLQNRNSTAV